VKWGFFIFDIFPAQNKKLIQQRKLIQTNPYFRKKEYICNLF